MSPNDPLWDDAFHAAAWQAFAEGVAQGQGIPDSNVTKRRAYAIYEAALNEPTEEPAPLDSPG